MGIGDAILVVSCLGGLMLALPALLIFLNLALIGISDRATYRLSRGGIIPFFVGLIPIIFIGIPAFILIAAGSIFQFFGSLVMLFLLFLGFMGLAVVARLVGQRLTAMNERDESPLFQTVTGTLVLSFGIAFPLLGWLIVFPFSLVVGTGAVFAVMIGSIGRFFRGGTPTVVTPRPAWQE